MAARIPHSSEYPSALGVTEVSRNLIGINGTLQRTAQLQEEGSKASCLAVTGLIVVFAPLTTWLPGKVR